MVEVGRTWVILAFYLMTSSTLGHPLIGMKQNHRWRPFNLIEEPAGGGRSLSPNVGLSYGGLTFKDLANTYQDEPETQALKLDLNDFASQLKSSLTDKISEMIAEEEANQPQHLLSLPPTFRGGNGMNFKSESSKKRRYLPGHLLNNY